jgi:pimeloyl-ACP methyl ester carboxylesterase
MARWDRGDVSEAPAWFWEAVEVEPESRRVEVEDADIAFRLYDGASTKPPLLLVHGMNAHARWWDFIAPQLLDTYRVAAMDLSGMGDSDYRHEYDGETFAAEIAGVCTAAGFGDEAVVVAHSFGGGMAVKAANQYPGRFAGLVLVDSGLRHPDEPMPERPPMGGGRAKAYPDIESGMQRFRLQPPQPCDNAYIVHYIARHSLMPVERGYAWKFDPDLPSSLKSAERSPDDYRNLRLPLGLIYGELSEMFRPRNVDYMRELVGRDFPAVAIPGARHHVFLDQPLEFVRVLKGMLPALRGA